MTDLLNRTEQDLKKSTGLSRRKRKQRGTQAAVKRWKSWKNATEEERAAYAATMSAVSKGHGRPRDTAQPRCKCKVMTLKRARARGAEAAHKPTCTFYPR